jgi:hypothetical protein
LYLAALQSPVRAAADAKSKPPLPRNLYITFSLCILSNGHSAHIKRQKASFAELANLILIVALTRLRSKDHFPLDTFY